MRTLKFALPPTRTPNESQGNIGGAGSSGIGARISRVHFMLFVSTSFALGTLANAFSVEYGLKLYSLITLCVFCLALGHKMQRNLSW